MTTHSLARELLEKPDGFVTATIEGKEFAVTGFQRMATCANYDDTSLYWTLVLSECENNKNKKVECIKPL